MIKPFFTVNKELKWYKFPHYLFNFALAQWFYVALAILIAIAAEFPNFARHGGLIRAEYTIGYGAVALIFLQNGLSMRTNIFLAHLSDWRAHILAMTMQFLITGSIMFGICSGIKAAKDDRHVDKWILAGAVVTSTSPTTVASNVIMTRKAKGSYEKTISAVFAGNLVGGFVSPLLVQMYFSNPSWEFANPSKGSSFNELYKRVMKQLGLSVFIPLFVGQCILNLNPEKVLKFNAKFRLNKIGSICLLLNLFSCFSTAFYQDAFTSMPGASIIMIFFLNIGLYLLFSLIAMLLARNYFIKKFIVDRPPNANNSSKGYRAMHRFLSKFYFSPPDAVALLFVCPAKTAALGIALTTSQYGDDFANLGKLLAALVLYQTEQVLVANFLVVPARKWVERCVKEQDQKQDDDEESGGVEEERNSTSTSFSNDDDGDHQQDKKKDYKKKKSDDDDVDDDSNELAFRRSFSSSTRITNDNDEFGSLEHAQMRT